jgi:hypothetical protein
MANPKSTQSQSQTQSWVARSYDGAAASSELDADDDELDLADSEGIPTSTPDEYRLELDTSSDGDLIDELAQRANEEIIGDVDGEDYRAGTLDPDGSDRGLRVASSDLIEEDETGRRNAVGPGMGDGKPGLGDDSGGER